MALGGERVQNGHLISCVNIPSCLLHEDRDDYPSLWKGPLEDVRFTAQAIYVRKMNWEILCLIC